MGSGRFGQPAMRMKGQITGGDRPLLEAVWLAGLGRSTFRSEV